MLKYRGWARILTLVVSALGMFDFPVGTGLGVYGLWVLTHRDVSPLFQEAPAPLAER